MGSDLQPKVTRIRVIFKQIGLLSITMKGNTLNGNMGLGKSSVEESGVHSWADGDPTSLTTMRIEAPEFCSMASLD